MITNPQRFAATAKPPAGGGGSGWQTAIDAAHKAGTGLGRMRRWVESEGIGKRPLTTLGVAFGLGLFTGWLVKR